MTENQVFRSNVLTSEVKTFLIWYMHEYTHVDKHVKNGIDKLKFSAKRHYMIAFYFKSNKKVITSTQLFYANITINHRENI